MSGTPRLPGNTKHRKPSAPLEDTFKAPDGHTMASVTCDQCGETFTRKAYHVARSRREGRRQYCGNGCAKAALRARATGVRGTGLPPTTPRRYNTIQPSRAVRQQAEIRDSAQYRPQPGRDVDRAGAPRTKVAVVPVNKRGNQW